MRRTRYGSDRALALTGTISLLTGNVASRTESVFAFSFHPKVLMPDGTQHRQEVSGDAVRLYQRLLGADAGLPDIVVNTAALAPAGHVAVRAAAQDHIDAAISKAINVPEDIAFPDFQDVYRRTRDAGCEGCTACRPNDVTGSVLSTTPEPKSETDQPQLPLRQAAHEPEALPTLSAVVISLTRPLARPETLVGATYGLRWPESGHATYIIINDIENGGRRRRSIAMAPDAPCRRGRDAASRGSCTRRAATTATHADTIAAPKAPRPPTPMEIEP